MFATWREGFSMVPLVVVLIAVGATVATNLAGPGIDDLLHPWSLGWQFWPMDYSIFAQEDGPLLIGVELTAVPVTAIAAAKLGLAPDRLALLHQGRMRLFLPLLMAASLVGVAAYLVWSLNLPQSVFGPNEFGVFRWLGVALLAAFTWFWLPVFPRVTAKLAGMIGGPTLFAAAGYLLFAEVIKNEPGSSEISGVYTMLAVVLALAADLLLLVSGRLWWNPRAHAVWTGVLMAGLSYVGTLVYA